ncbi:hypothetical protein N0V92_013137 [Colletotrichum tropicale]|nr:hypothetical protein N0V92_013137 [Colletotrichum tropicale]
MPHFIQAHDRNSDPTCPHMTCPWEVGSDDKTKQEHILEAHGEIQRLVCGAELGRNDPCDIEFHEEFCGTCNHGEEQTQQTPDALEQSYSDDEEAFSQVLMKPNANGHKAALTNGEDQKTETIDKTSGASTKPIHESCNGTDQAQQHNLSEIGST